MNKRAHGKFFEDLAVDFLKNKGYKIIQRNFNCSFGEIDIIAEKNSILCFIEVKARTKDIFGTPLSAITLQKQKRMIRVAEFYCMKNKIADKPIRFEAIGIEVINNKPVFDHVENIVF
ncbi:MAG: YraN family protein [Proteobacteria bacterium]|nr:YraN family protein [Pseudomonadota bacterium]